MGNLILCPTTLGDNATLSGGGWVPTLPLANGQSQNHIIPARSLDTDPANTQFNTALTQTRPMRAIGIGYHNLSVSARITAIGTSGATETFRETFDAYDAVHRTQDLEYEDDNFWYGKPDDQDLKNIPRTSTFYFDKPVYADSVSFEISDENNTAGYVQFARLLIANGYQPSINMSYGSSETLEDLTTSRRTISGSRIFDPRPTRRGKIINLNDLPEYEARMAAHELMRLQGTSGQVFFCPDPDDLSTRQLKAFYGYFISVTALDRAAFGHASVSFPLLEL